MSEIAQIFSYSENDQPDELDQLLKSTADKESLLTAVNTEGLHPLHAATIMNSPKAVEVLLAHGANPNATAPRGDYAGFVALELAMKRRYRALINLLEPVTKM